MSDSHPRICFVAPNNYAVLSGDPNVRHIGGAEVQRALVARELVRRGWNVSFITLDHGQPDGINHNGIRVFKAYATKDGLPGLRFFHPRWTGLRAAMKRADADIYIQRTAGIETGQVAQWARQHGRRFIYAVASEPECDERVGNRSSWRERRFFQYGLRHAHDVVAQTERQVELLESTYDIYAFHIPSCAIDPREPTPREFKTRRDGGRVLWVGRFSRPKRVDRLLQIVKTCPNIQFDVVGDHPNPPIDIAAAIAALKKLPNVTMHGFVPYTEVSKYYEQAALLLCTSEWEGFPNTFLEAWSRGIPVVSSVDPDHLIREDGLGCVFETTEDARAAIRLLLDDGDAYEAATTTARAHFLREHSVEACGDQWERLFNSGS